MKRIAIWKSIVTSLTAAIIYILAGAGAIYAGDILEANEAPPSIFFVAGAFYILIAFLVNIEKRWLRIALAILNGMVIIIFFQMWANRPDVLTSAAGLGTKIPQFLLEICLIYLVIKTERRS